jgi:hypothetical protein
VLGRGKGEAAEKNQACDMTGFRQQQCFQQILVAFNDWIMMKQAGIALGAYSRNIRQYGY